MMKRQTTVAALLALLVAALILSGCPQPPAQEPPVGPIGDATPPPGTGETIRQAGSTTVLPLAQKWQEAFNQTNPGVNIAVSGGGSGTGLKALISKTAELANSSREIKDKETEEAKAAGVNPIEHIVGYDGIAVIVHKDNPLTQITLKELSDLYSGATKEWGGAAKGLGKVQLINRDSSSGTYDSFKEMVVQLHGKAKDKDFAPGTLNQTSNQAILSMVGQTRTAIGYVSLGYIDETVKALKVVGADGQPVEATVETVQSRQYPISRALYAYTDGEPAGALKQYLDFVKGAEGQEIVKELGFVPLPAASN